MGVVMRGKGVGRESPQYIGLDVLRANGKAGFGGRIGSKRAKI